MPARVARCGDDQVRLREKTIGVGIAAAGPYEREDEQCLETRFGGVTDLGEDHVRRRGRIRPRATVELEPNAQGEKRQSPEIELEAVAVREPGLDPACGRLVRAPGSRTEREVVHGVRGELREPQLPCLVERPLQRASSPVRNSSTVPSSIEASMPSRGRRTVRASSNVRSPQAITLVSSPRYAAISAIAAVASPRSALSGSSRARRSTGSRNPPPRRGGLAREIRHEAAPGGRRAVERARSKVVFDRQLELGDSLDLVVREVQGVRPPLVERRLLFRRQTLREGERAGILRGGLAMCSEARRLFRRRRRESKHRLAVGSMLGVVGDARKVGRSVGPVGEREQHPAVERQAPLGTASPRRRRAPARGGMRCRPRPRPGRLWRGTRRPSRRRPRTRRS